MVPLNIKTDGYLLKSMIKIKELIKVAKENNIKALTITDDNMYNVMEFYNLCIKENIKPIIGLEIQLPEKIILYAKNYKGYKNLLKLTTIKSEKNLTYDILANLSEGLLCIIPYESKVHYTSLNKIYEDLYVSYKDNIQREKIKLKNKLYMKEILCIKKEDEKYLKYLKAIKEGKNHIEIEDIKDVSLLPLNNENNEEIIEKCNIKIKMNQNLIPKYSEEDSYEVLKRHCIEGMRRLFGSSAPKKYALRLKEELSVIQNMGYCDYFLIVEDYVKYAKEKGILVGPGRGSAAGSLTAYTLNITTIDPLKYDLFFERFLNKERVTMPDIDIDFEDERREEVIRYCRDKYGEDKVALIITFGTLASKQSIRDVCKVLDIEPKKVDILTKMLDSKKSLKENFNPKIKKYLEMNRELMTAYKIASKFEGLKRHTSIHAAGLVMAGIDLKENIPLDKSEKYYISQYDKDYLEDLGLLKMDFLGIKNLTLIKNILSEIKDLTFDTIPENDKKALEIFKNANTTGIFQFESKGMVNFIKKLKPDTFDDIVAALALFRPGPMKNIDSYIRRKRGVEKIDYFHEDLKEILKPTYGIIVYQEQIMRIASTMAGYSFSEADELRRAMSKKKEEILIREKDRFINGSVKKGYNKDLATKVYDLIFKFAEYGFNKSHTVAYAIVSYRMAYLKAHYPNIFMKYLLTNAINSEEKTKDYIYECQKYGIKIEVPDINLSDKRYKLINNSIYYPLNNIKDIGINAVTLILEERKKGKFKDIFDFVSRCYKGAVNITVLKNLILSGAMNNFGINKKTLIDNLEIITNYGEIGSLDEDIFKPELEIKEEYSKEELMKYELELFGFYLSSHPITEYKRREKHIELNEIQKYFDRQIETVIYIDKIRKIDTKNKQKMMFITGSDELSKIELVVFPKVYEKIPTINEGNIIKVRGRVEKRYDEYQIIVINIIKLT
ncbi:MAG: DNA polymerase III subunit alpha [Bacilli bacterium]|nr:DNA polymerase III subunit alpha [Bacilli bacterium]